LSSDTDRDDTDAFFWLPAEVIDHIFSFAAPDLTSISRVCRLFRAICEALAEVTFKSQFGSTKPRAMSWCHCLKVVAQCFAHEAQPVSHTVLFYGVSHTSLMTRFDLQHTTDKSRRLLYETLLFHGMVDVISNLFMPLILRHKLVGQELLAAIVAADDEPNFEALERSIATNGAQCLSQIKFDPICFYHKITPHTKLLSRLYASPAFKQALRIND
jgi:hypothetical protein